MDSFAVFVALFFITCACFLSFRSGLRRRRAAKLPPGPYPLPIVGNIFQLDKNPHQSFAHLSKTYGPLMSIHLGSVYTVIISSPEMAREILQKHGQIFSGRHISQALHAHGHDKMSMAFLPISNNKWRDIRKICKEQMFSNHRLEASQGLRQEKLQQLLDYVQKCCHSRKAVKIREAALITTINLMSTTLFSLQATEFESKATQEFKEIIECFTTLIGLRNFADYFPILRPFDPHGIKRMAEYYFGVLLAKIDGYVDERLESRRTNPNSPKKNDLLETLVDISQGNEYQLTNDDIKRLLLDLFVGGSDPNSATIEWTMSELLINPHKLSKLKHELKTVVGENKHVQESDMPRLPYLQAVIKEILRIHPPGPLSLPRKAESDQEVKGYMIPKGTQILINLWAMGRDPNLWPNPDSFEPERFLDHKTEFKGQHFELIPFGAGRRICPGMPLAHRILHMTVATLVHNFDWKLEEGATDADHKREVLGAALCRAVPLRAIPVKP